MNEIEFEIPTEQTHFLVSGGGKGITAEAAVALADAFHSCFTLIGRSEVLEGEPSWSENHQEPAELKKEALVYFQEHGQRVTPKDLEREVKRILSSREIHRTLDRIHQAGGKADYIQADITQAQALRDALGDRISTINALLHGAGALADKYIEDKTEQDFDLVYGVKVGGLKNLLEILDPEQLNFMVFFSSVAGFYGNAGQADYSLSNEILNKLAFHLKRSHPECHILAIDWGPWDGGMVTPQLKRILTKKKISLISPQQGAQALVDLLSTPGASPQYVIGTPLPFPPRKVDPTLKSYRIKRTLHLEDNPFLADHVIAGQAVLPTVCAVAWFVNTSTGLYPDFKFHAVKDYRVYKGIVFDESAAPEYLLELHEMEKNPNQILLDGKISSQIEKNTDRYHYQAIVELVKEVPERPQLSEFDLKDNQPLSAQELYASRVLFHGPRFQGVKKVLNISEKSMTTECRLPVLARDQMGQFRITQFNPLLADVHLQSLLIWSHHVLGRVGLPLKIASGVQYEMPPLGETSFTTMKVVSTTNHKLVADVISHDQRGRIYTEVQGAEITLNDSLYTMFQSNRLEEEPAWI